MQSCFVHGGICVPCVHRAPNQTPAIYAAMLATNDLKIRQNDLYADEIRMTAADSLRAYL